MGSTTLRRAAGRCPTWFRVVGLAAFATRFLNPTDLVPLSTDILHVMWPSYLPSWAPVYMRNIATAETFDLVSASDCPNNDSTSALDVPNMFCSVTTTKPGPDAGGLSAGSIGGIVGGIVAGIIGVAGIGWATWMYKKRRAQQIQAEQDLEDMRGFVRMEDVEAPLPEGAEKVLERRGVRN